MPLFDAIASSSLPSITSFAGRNMSNTFWAFATLSRRDGPLLAALAAEARRKIHHCTAQDLSSPAWSCSQLAYSNEPLFAAIAASARARMQELCAQDLANTAWSFAYFLLADTPLLEALAASAIRTMAQFEAQNLATTAWALEELGYEHEPLLHAISAEVIRTIAQTDPTPTATLLDRRLWPECHEALGRRLLPVVERFCAALPGTVAFWRDGGYQRLVLDFGVGNFGSVGGRHLRSRLGIAWPDGAFLSRAAEHVRIGRAMGGAYSDGVEFIRQRVVTYAEHGLSWPGLAQPLCGAGVHTNGRAHRSRWLVPVRPPFCPDADRGTCSEFRMLAALCDLVAHSDPQGVCDARVRAQVTGLLQALVSGPCCVSCIGAFAQFHILFPSVDVRVAAGKMPSTLPRSEGATAQPGR